MKIWKDIPGLEGKYQVNKQAEIKSLSRQVRPGYILKERILSPSINHQGYYWFSIGKGLHMRVHRAVALAFIPNPNNLPFVNHIDGDKQNNALDNLEWCTVSENTKHAYKLGLSKKALQDGAKLTKKQILEIKQLLKTQIFLKDIALLYKVSSTTISSIKNGKTWSHIINDGTDSLEKEGYIKPEKVIKALIAHTESDKRRVKIVDTANNKIYSSMKEAAKVFNEKPSYLYRMLNGIRPNRTTLKYLS